MLQKAVLQEGHFHIVTAGAQAHENFLSHLHLNAHYKEKLPNRFQLKHKPVMPAAKQQCIKRGLTSVLSSTQN